MVNYAQIANNLFATREARSSLHGQLVRRTGAQVNTNKKRIHSLTGAPQLANNIKNMSDSVRIRLAKQCHFGGAYRSV